MADERYGRGAPTLSEALLTMVDPKAEAKTLHLT